MQVCLRRLHIWRCPMAGARLQKWLFLRTWKTLIVARYRLVRERPRRRVPAVCQLLPTSGRKVRSGADCLMTLGSPEECWTEQRRRHKQCSSAAAQPCSSPQQRGARKKHSLAEPASRHVEDSSVHRGQGQGQGQERAGEGRSGSSGDRALHKAEAAGWASSRLRCAPNDV